jgi:cytochrome P450
MPLRRSSPPKPESPPAIQARRWISRPYEFLDECAKTFGDVFALELASDRHVVFSNPEHLREIFTAPADTLHVGPGNAVLEPIVGSASLLLLEEQQHVHERQRLVPAFFQRAISRYGSFIREVTLGMTMSWDVGTKFVAHEILQEISIGVIMRAVFGLETGAVHGELKSELVGFLNNKQLNLGLLARLRERQPHPTVAGLKARLMRIRLLASAAIEERRARPPGEDVLSLLLAVTDATGKPRPDEEIVDELLTLVVTGHETTATALGWALYWTSLYPDVARRVRDELRTVESFIDMRRLGSLKYLDAVCKEVLRIYPIVPSVFRQVVRPFHVAGFDFRPGTVIAPSIYLTHRRQELFPAPEKFEPERFLDRTYSPYEYLPFGGGARRCIGMQLANFEMKIVLGTLLQRFELAVIAPAKTTPIRRVATMAPSEGLPMHVTGLLA